MDAENSNRASSPDVRAVMAEIRRHVREGLDNSPLKAASMQNAAPKIDTSTPLVCSEDLNYLNAHWNDWVSPADISSHRKIVGPFIVRFKKFFSDLVWNYLLKGYFERERQFQMRLVRHLNSSARYIDARQMELFWQLVDKIDRDVAGSHERGDLLYERLSGHLRALEKLVEKQPEPRVANTQFE